MKRLAYPQSKRAPLAIVIISYLFYVVLFALLRNSVGLIIGALSIIPVVAASWYFGYKVGIFTALLCILNNIIQQAFREPSIDRLAFSSSEVIDSFVLVFTALVVGNLKILMEERNNALLKLEQYERERQSY
ncbi:MAG TPA: hypothetical protein VLE49_22655, partial [Anaerolineales bacterium]|nr:hypothetical protein [Anaerolineales bacterium]